MKVDEMNGKICIIPEKHEKIVFSDLNYAIKTSKTLEQHNTYNMEIFEEYLLVYPDKTLAKPAKNTKQTIFQKINSFEIKISKYKIFSLLCGFTFSQLLYLLIFSGENITVIMSLFEVWAIILAVVVFCREK